MKEREGLPKAHMSLTRRQRQQCNDGHGLLGVGAGWRWANGGKWDSVMVSTIKLKLKQKETSADGRKVEGILERKGKAGEMIFTLFHLGPAILKT